MIIQAAYIYASPNAECPGCRTAPAIRASGLVDAVQAAGRAVRLLRTLEVAQILEVIVDLGGQTLRLRLELLQAYRFDGDLGFRDLPSVLVSLQRRTLYPARRGRSSPFVKFGTVAAITSGERRAPRRRRRSPDGWRRRGPWPRRSPG